MQKSFFILYLIFISVFDLYGQEKQITEAEVTRIINFLADDELRGRQVFTPGIEKASDFIEKEFKKIGLKTFKGLNDYEQEFSVYNVTPVSLQAMVNGARLPTEAIAVGGNAAFEKLTWTEENPNQPEKIFVSAADDFLKVASQLLEKEPMKDYLILVDPAHTARFGRVKKYLEKSVVKLTKEGHTFVFLLTDQPAIQNYSLSVHNKVNDQKANNVVGVLPGKSKKNEYVIFSAHYDHIGIMPSINGDSIANGADDDASGTTAVIALAKYFKERKNNARTLVFVAFTFEESGGYGSQYFSKQLDPDNVVAMFNVEMIGKESKFGSNSGFITGFDKSDLGSIVQKNLAGSVYQFHPDPYTQQNLFYRSDNATLAKLGVPAHSFSTDQIDVDPFYHGVDDEVETLNITHMTNTIRAIAKGAESIVTGKDTPTRIPPLD